MEENEKYFLKYHISFKAPLSHSEFHFQKSMELFVMYSNTVLLLPLHLHIMEITDQLRKCWIK